MQKRLVQSPRHSVKLSMDNGVCKYVCYGMVLANARFWSRIAASPRIHLREQLCRRWSIRGVGIHHSAEPALPHVYILQFTLIHRTQFPRRIGCFIGVTRRIGRGYAAQQ